jgi:hypothetical protein
MQCLSYVRIVCHDTDDGRAGRYALFFLKNKKGDDERNVFVSSICSRFLRLDPFDILLPEPFIVWLG